MYSIPKAQALDIVTAVIATTPFTAAIMKLSTTNFTPNRDTVLADFTEADFTGYAASGAITWGAAHLDPNGNARSAGSALTFLQTASTINNIVYSWWVETALGAYLFGGAFDTPINFSGPGVGLVVVPEFIFNGN